MICLGMLFSCKHNSKNKGDNTKVSDASADNRIEETNNQQTQGIKVIQSNFSKIQDLLDTKSDTIYITNYWATWCPPCVKEIPDFVKLQNQYKNKKVKFIFVSIDETEDQAKLQSFVKENKMKNVYNISREELLSNIGSISTDLVGGIPVTIIQKGDKREGFLGNISNEFVIEKIQQYSK